MGKHKAVKYTKALVELPKNRMRSFSWQNHGAKTSKLTLENTACTGQFLSLIITPSSHFYSLRNFNNYEFEAQRIIGLNVEGLRLKIDIDL